MKNTDNTINLTGISSLFDYNPIVNIMRPIDYKPELI